MNKNIFILLTLIFSSTCISGQTNKISLGFELGPSLINLRGNEILEQLNGPAIGFLGSISSQYNFSKIISIRTNIAYERKGAVAKIQAVNEYGNSDGNIITHSNFDYLTIPLLARLTLGMKIKYFVNIGPYAGYLIKQETVTKAFNNIPKTKINETSKCKRLDFGLTAGIGAELPINDNFYTTIEIRNNLGLNDISAVKILDNGKIKTNSTNFIIGIAYKLGNKINN